MRERGLKCEQYYLSTSNITVAPHAGAWIEIDGSERDSERPESLPMRERGLK